ncbi:MAG: AAA family ATPase [Sphingobacteriales bacterium]|nr:MAG: AAA family ATPase [Sphingobacteriales bacterium]
MKTAVQQLFQPLDEGRHILIHRGRDMRDLTTDSQGRMLPLLEAVRSEALIRGLVLIEYSKSSGVTYDANSLTKPESQDIDKVLSSLGINKPQQNCGSNEEQDFVRTMRGLLALVQSDKYPTFRDGRPMAFMLIIHFAEHNTPSMQPGFHSNEQMISIELASTLSKSLGLRKSGSYVIFSEAREGALDDIISKHIDVLRLYQPAKDEKVDFLTALQNKYPSVQLETGLTSDIIVNITSNSPNRGLEQIFYTSFLTKSPVTTASLSFKKQEDIIRMSEGTLESVDMERIKGKKLVGRNIQRPLEILKITTDALREGKVTAIRNCILAGAPATGKTDLAIMTAFFAKVQAFTLNSPKSSLVGESERKTKLMLSILKEQRGIGIIDELEMVLPMNRGNQNNDSGVTSNLMGQLQQFLSDSSLAGRVSLIATSNKPGSISAAMLSRWVVVPVLMPLLEDMPFIIMSLMESLGFKESLNFIAIDNNEKPNFDNENLLKSISERFYYASASPRDIRESLISAMAFIPGEVSMEHLLFAGENVVPSANRESYIHSDLVALLHTKSNAYLPWWDIQNNKPYDDYPFPSYILEVLDSDKKVDYKQLSRKIEELEPFVNV